MRYYDDQGMAKVHYSYLVIKEGSRRYEIKLINSYIQAINRKIQLAGIHTRSDDHGSTLTISIDRGYFFHAVAIAIDTVKELDQAIADLTKNYKLNTITK